MELKDLCGKHIFSGIEIGSREEKGFSGYPESMEYIKFTLDGRSFVAVADPYDGYRSFMRELEEENTPCAVALTDVEVLAHMDSNPENNILILSECCTGSEILRVGTAYYYDYYPYYVMDYQPENLSCNQQVKNNEEDI